MEENISLGTLLRNARESKKIILEDIATKTKININILRAIEEDDIENLPNIAYLKGFVKNFAKFVGVDPNQAIQSMEDTLQIKKETPTPQNHSAEENVIDAHQMGSELEDQELKENLISIVQSFFNKKIIFSLLALGIVVIIVKTVVNWVAELNFESNKISEIKEAPTQPNDLKSSDQNILEMDASKKFAAQILKDQADEDLNQKGNEKETVAVESKTPTETSEEKSVELPKPTASETKKEPEKVKEEKPKEVVRADGKFPYRNFNPAPMRTFSVIDNAPENEDPVIFPPNFRAAMEDGVENVFIHATDDDVWMSYKSDDDPIKRFVLRKGRKLLIKGSVIRLFLANYRVAKVFHNNKLMEIRPTKSGVRSIIFPQSAAKDYKLPLFPVYKGKSYTSDEYIQNMAEPNIE